METSKPLTGVKKRQQIQQANRIVFIWVAIAAAIVSVALVMTQFMFRQFLFNNKVYAAQIKTNNTLLQNAKAYDPLKTEVTKLVSNQDLTRLRVDPADNALQVIIDAMPTVDDRIGLAASLQQVVLARSGVTIDGIGFVDQQLGAATTSTTATNGVNQIQFSFTATGSYDAIKSLLDAMHHSIRPVDVNSIKLTGTASTMTAEVQATTYYATPKTVNLSKETIKP